MKKKSLSLGGCIFLLARAAIIRGGMRGGRKTDSLPLINILKNSRNV
jgi:hypothetical protein